MFRSTSECNCCDHIHHCFKVGGHWLLSLFNSIISSFMEKPTGVFQEYYKCGKISKAVQNALWDGTGSCCLECLIPSDFNECILSLQYVAIVPAVECFSKRKLCIIVTLSWLYQFLGTTRNWFILWKHTKHPGVLAGSPVCSHKLEPGLSGLMDIEIIKRPTGAAAIFCIYNLINAGVPSRLSHPCFLVLPELKSAPTSPDTIGAEGSSSL